MAEARASSDADEFDTFVATLHAPIRRYLRRIIVADGEAEDLCQETFLRALRAWGERPDEPGRRAWVYAIATNALRNHVRSERRRRIAYATVRIARLEIERDGPEDETLADETRRRTEAAIRHLPPKQRLAFIMRKLEDLDYDEIGACLGCSAETARAHVFQALRKLRAAVLGRAGAGANEAIR